MSSSDAAPDAATDAAAGLVEGVRRLRAECATSGRALSQRALCDLLAETVRLYAEQSADPYGDVAAEALQTTPTEACTVAASLLHAQALTPFEFSIWYSGARRGGPRP